MSGGYITPVVQVRTERVISITAGARTFSGLRITGEWEGFIKAEAGTTFVIFLDERGSFTKTLDDIFIGAEQPVGMTLVRCSHDVLEALAERAP